MQPIIVVDNLTKDYGFGRGVFNISFEIYQGETFGFLGPNGAGKTTTIRHLMGFSAPQSGQVTINGKKVFTHYASLLKNVGYIPGELAFPAGLRGFELLKMIEDLTGKHDQERRVMLCNLFKLSDLDLQSGTKQMSLGTKRKLAIVTAFMSDPDILILDEPTSGLDPLLQDVFIAFLKEEKKRGKTILLSSHIFHEVDQTCDRISIIKQGRIVDTFIADDLRHDQQKHYLLKFTDSRSYHKFNTAVRILDYVRVLASEEARLEVVVLVNDAHIKELITLLTNYKLQEFRHLKETLQDYFLKFYKDGEEFGGLK